MKSNYRKALKILYYVFGLFAFVSYFTYFVKLLIWRETAFNFVIAICGCIITIVPVAFRPFFEKYIPNKVFRLLENLFTYGMGIYTVSFIALVVYVSSARVNNTKLQDIESDSVVIVFGAGLTHDKPGSVLRRRLNSAVEILNEKDSAVCIVTGCQGENESVSEASAMRDYLIEKGIDEERIFVEDRARNTIENIEYSKDLADSVAPNSRLVLVSSAFHVPRIMMIAKSMSLHCDYVFAENSKPLSLYASFVREYMAYIKFIVFKSA